MLKVLFSFICIFGQTEVFSQSLNSSDFELQQLREQIINQNGSVKMDYAGEVGQLEYAKDYYHSHLGHAVSETLPLLSETEIYLLNWSFEFQGTNEEFIEIRELLMQGKSEIDYARWFGESTGLVEFVEAYQNKIGLSGETAENELLRYRILARGSLSFLEQVKLGWTAHEVNQEGLRGISDRIKLKSMRRFVSEKADSLLKKYDTISIIKAIKASIHK